MKNLIITVIYAMLASSALAADAPKIKHPCEKEALAAATFIYGLGMNDTEGFTAEATLFTAEETPLQYTYKVQFRDAGKHLVGDKYEIVLSQDYRSEACMVDYLKTI